MLHRPSFRLAIYPKRLTRGRAAPAAGGRRAERVSVFQTVTEETTELSFPSRVESIAEAADAAAVVARRAGFPDDALFGIDMAVREAATNAVLHGNKQDASKRFEVGLGAVGNTFVVTVRDCGEGFDPAAVPDPTDPQNLLKASGRGILFMRTFMDEVTWERHPAGGTVVRMTKKR